VPTLTTVAGWVVVLTLGYSFVHYSRKTQKGRRQAAEKQASRATEQRKDPKAKKARKEGIQSASDDGNKPVKSDKKKKNQTVTKPDVPETTVFTTDDADHDEVDNAKFAREIAARQAGTVLASKNTNANRQKSVKQSRAQEKEVTREFDGGNASSATGGDADDDRSPIDSPEFGATNLTPVANGDISDMLEPAASGPSILRVTEPTNPVRPKKENVKQSFVPVESKKQRQNRQKAEAAKLIREQEEKDRKIKEEKQRRTAREAEGRAAKDGSKFLASQAPKTSVWTPPTSGSNATAPANGDLLDTLEKPAASTKEVPSELYSESELAGSQWQELSEEEQIAHAIEDSKNWNVVKAKERKKKTQVEPKDNPAPAEEKEYGAPEVIEPTGPGKRWNMTTTHVENGDVVETEKEVQDSEWEVA